jgi:hypothetical protein
MDAIDADSKLVPTRLVGERSLPDAYTGTASAEAASAGHETRWNATGVRKTGQLFRDGPKH